MLRFYSLSVKIIIFVVSLLLTRKCIEKSMFLIKKFTFNPFQENTYILSDETGECVIIDPGCYENFEKKELEAYIKDNNLKPVKLLNTHCHIDHVLGNNFVSKLYNIKPEHHELELPVLASIPQYAHMYGMGGYEEAPSCESFIVPGTEIKFGNQTLEVIFGPGHAPGHVAFYNKKEKILIGGDILFEGSFGRTDLPGGNFDTLKETLINTIFKLPEEIVVYTGHGNETTIGKEKKTNPILTF